MSVVAVRGAICAQQIDSVAKDAMIALLLFTAAGAVAGWIAEYLIEDSLERAFHRRVQWYRQGLAEQTQQTTTPTDNE